VSVVGRRSRSFTCLLLGGACLLATGCGSNSPKTLEVSGKVTWQGQPLPDGAIAFTPVNGPSRPAVGKIGADGAYRLSSFRPGDGAMPGEYRVTVESYTSWPTRTEPEKPYVCRIPERYGKPAQSGLSFTIPADAGGRLVFDVDLKP
jgi:hypothetical protein